MSESFMAEFQKSDGIEEEPTGSQDGDDEDRQELQSIRTLADAAATHAARGSRMSSSGPSSDAPTFGSDSVLGRRQRDSSSEPHSDREKVRLQEFTLDVCTELGVASTDRDKMVAYSQVRQSSAVNLDDSH